MSAFVRTRPARPVQSMINGIARWAGKDALTALQDIKADWAPVMEPVMRPNGQAIENKMSVINPVADKVLGITSTNYGGMHLAFHIRLAGLICLATAKASGLKRF